MFGKEKSKESRFIIAIKDYSTTMNAIKDGSLYLPYNREIYLTLLENKGVKAESIKELGKFIKASKKEKNEVSHFWESLISQGYTLINVQYEEKKPSLESLCNTNLIKYICEL